MTEQETHQIIITALATKKCKCPWILISRNHDRYRLHSHCGKPCKARDDMIGKVNTG